MSNLQTELSDDDYRRLGIAKPETPAREVDELARYAAQHCVCPGCRLTGSVETTTVGVMYPQGTKAEQMHDTNDAVCVCGWRGRVHDLLPRKA